MCFGESCVVTLNENSTMHLPSNNFLSIFFGAALIFLPSSSSTHIGAYDLLSMIVTQHLIFYFVEEWLS